MKIKTVSYVGSFGYPHRLPREQRPEVAMFGRSNVGKSSLINTLLGRRGIARISKTPGKTRTANFFLINERFFLVDMPGYGYAKVAKGEKERWTKLFDQYLGDDARSNALVQLIDIRHEPTGQDVESVARLVASGRPLCLAFNKSDKVKRGASSRSIAAALRVLDVPPETAVIPFSSVSGEGRAELWTWISDALAL
jgi:GTP-binding protein